MTVEIGELKEMLVGIINRMDKFEKKISKIENDIIDIKNKLGVVHDDVIDIYNLVNDNCVGENNNYDEDEFDEEHKIEMKGFFSSGKVYRFKNVRDMKNRVNSEVFKYLNSYVIGCGTEYGDTYYGDFTEGDYKVNYKYRVVNECEVNIEVSISYDSS